MGFSLLVPEPCGGNTARLVNQRWTGARRVSQLPPEVLLGTEALSSVRTEHSVKACWLNSLGRAAALLRGPLLRSAPFISGASDLLAVEIYL